MLKRTGFFLLLILMLASRLQAQSPTDPQYAVAFSGGIDTYIAILQGDNTWQINTLPQPIILDQFDVMLVTPKWAGQNLYVTLVETELDADGYVSIMRGGKIGAYNVLTGEITEITDRFGGAELPAYLTTGELPDYIAYRIDSVSPDGHYAWIRTTYDYQAPSELLDLQTGNVLPTGDCQADVLVWRENDVIVTSDGLGPFPCEPAVYSLDLATGERAIDFIPSSAAPDTAWEGFVFDAVVLADGRLLVGSKEPDPYFGSSPTAILAADGSSSEYFGLATHFVLSPDEKTVLLKRDNNDIESLNLETLTLTKLNASDGENVPPYWAGETIHFWEGRGTEAQREIVHVALTGAERLETVVYSGAAPVNSQFAASGEVAALEFENGNERWVEIYRAGEKVWSSADAYPDSIISLSYYVYPQFQASGSWLHLMQWESSFESGQYITLSVNFDTLETFLAPMPQGHLISESPDEAWWFYSNASQMSDAGDLLIAYHAATGETVTLSENIALTERNFHFTPSDYYIWSEQW